MELPEGNFFEVTINSQKLFSLITEIGVKMKQQEQQMKEMELSIKRAAAVS